MIIGIDFDNTIADYTGVFHEVARKLGWIPPHIGQSKTQVKEFFITQNQEPKWTELQGIVYGSHITLAPAYQHCLDVLKQLKQQGHKLIIISHKTKYPIIGEPTDLHQAATHWLKEKGFTECGTAPINVNDIYFNETKSEKVEQIKLNKCDVFIDDLEEILAHDQFPKQCKKILFSDQGSSLYDCIDTWADFNSKI
ncbi:hypothetical protein BGP78_15505 [Pseudoalteromonas sp. MSK9-3]|uniref:HAD family hydrolase n=1 Tax=Pseudoalteromonas sp. MSK9-3 TaxID=1897633 RepID=UPI000E6CCC67|nr:HAD family hydrolase [Pseudoalteromonas sp. MSK9-3]RJE75756.1 hypothetical protein BGP78_15505 [Pseudoalteromonas sp. MSK9-3]